MRSRALPAGTVGGRIAGTQMPRSHNARDTASVAALSPMTSGWMALDDGSSRHDGGRTMAASRSRKRAMLVSRRSRRGASPPMMARLSCSASASAGGDAVVKIYVRAFCTSHSIRVSCAQTKAPATPAALPSVPM